jgi:hypothetical protein
MSISATAGNTEYMTHTRKIMVTGMVAVALSAGAVGMAQAVDGESDSQVTAAQEDRAAQAALDVVHRGRVVSIEHDNEGIANWKVEVFKHGQQVESFSDRPPQGRHVVVYLDRKFDWLQAKVARYGPGS